MNSFYHLNTEHKIVIFRSPGRYTESDFINLLRGAYDDPRHTPQYDHIWDSRSIEELVVDVEVIDLYRDLLKEYEGQISQGKVAVIAVRTLTRTFSSMLAEVGTEHPATFRMFDDVEATAEWVGVPVSVITNVPDDGWTEV